MASRAGSHRPLANPTPKVGKLDEVHVPVLDLARMREYYEVQLGFRAAFSHEGRMVAFDTGGAMLVLDATKPRTGPAYLGFQVKGTTELIQRLAAGGTPVVTPTSKQHWGELLTIVEDPEGNLLAFEEGAGSSGHHHGSHRSRVRAVGE
ncbi:MAG: VOC family protein [Thermoplasmata archaeon]|nr:VOC family protein [Thermoplasmata archaeon]